MHSFEQIGQELGVDEVYAAAIFYGQVDAILVDRFLVIYANPSVLLKAKPTEDQIKKLTALLNIPTQHLVEEMGEHYFPSRGG